MNKRHIELFNRFSQKSAFQAGINEIRNKYNIGTDGIIEETKKLSTRRLESLKNDIALLNRNLISDDLINKELAPICELALDYVLAGQNSVRSNKKNSWWNYGVRIMKLDKNEVILKVWPHATKNDLIDAWKIAKTNWEAPKRIRTSTKMERDGIVYETYLQSRPAHNPSRTREAMVVEKLRGAYPGLQIGTVRTIVARMRKRKK